MSYYEKRIADLEARVAEMARFQRMKAIPVEANLVEQIANLQAENKRLRKAGDAMLVLWKTTQAGHWAIDEAEPAWDAAKDGKPTE